MLTLLLAMEALTGAGGGEGVDLVHAVTAPSGSQFAACVCRRCSKLGGTRQSRGSGRCTSARRRMRWRGGTRAGSAAAREGDDGAGC